MTSSARGVKRPRVSGEGSHDYALPFNGTGGAINVKAEVNSPYSEPGAYSHHTNSTAQTPESHARTNLSPYPAQYSVVADPSSRSRNTYTPPRYTPVSVYADGSSSNSEQPLKPPGSASPVSKGGSINTRSHASSAFRNVSACNRCRLRKNRCDQQLPACQPCTKAGVKCVGFDPFLGREVPRSYVFFLESRTSYLEQLLKDNGVHFTSAEGFALDKHSESELPAGQGIDLQAISSARGAAGSDDMRKEKDMTITSEPEQDLEQRRLDSLVSNIGMVYVQGSSDPRYLGATSGISFARVVMAAVKSTMSRASSDKGARSLKNATASTGSGGASLRDSAFGLHNKTAFNHAPFPERDIGYKLVNLYFEHANPQLPILHRGEFMELVERVYSYPDHRRTPREAYLLKIVFAIGAGIIFDSSRKANSNESTPSSKHSHKKKEKAIPNHQYQPEEYHAAATVHLENFLKSSTSGDPTDSTGNGLEELQAVLLLASFALLRPVAPGLWYIAGIAMRLAVDLGLHYEDNSDSAGLDDAPSDSEVVNSGVVLPDAKERGRRQWLRDMRRRLWWCVYSIDRLVSICVGRPFGITDVHC